MHSQKVGSGINLDSMIETYFVKFKVDRVSEMQGDSETYILFLQE